MAKRQLVLAVFPDEPAADSAASALKESGIAHSDAIGILVLDDNGNLKQDKVGARSVGKGAAIGGVIAVVGTAVLARRSWSARGSERFTTSTSGSAMPTRRASPMT